MPIDSPTLPNLDSSPPNLSGGAQSHLEAPTTDWTSTMTHSGPAGSSQSSPNKRRRDTMQQDIAGRDYYNNLAQSDLIDLVIKLQEQNLILTRLLERASAPTTAASTQLNLEPNLNFTRTKSGSAASRYASGKDFPQLKSGTKNKSTITATPTTTSAQPTVVSKKNSGTKKSLKKSTKTPANTEEAKKWALRLFTDEPNQSDTAQSSSTETTVPLGYTCVYLPINRKTKHADLREKLRILKINLNRIYAIQRPAKKVVSLLVHTGYAPDIVKICETEGIKPITNFNPISGTNLGDPKLLESLNEAQLNDKAKAIYFNRMLQAAMQLRDPRLGLTILKHFNAKDGNDLHYIPTEIVDQYITLKPDAIRKISTANKAKSVLKGFDASKLFASLANVDTNISLDGSNSLSTAISDANNSSMDLNQ